MNDSAIHVDDENTWPDVVRQLFEDASAVLRGYERERARIDALCREDVMARISPPWNKYRDKRNNVIAAADDLLSGECLVGYHCTRLHADEISAMLASGLQPLSMELLLDRIRRRVAVGDISEAMARRLTSENQAGDKNRNGSVALIFTRKPLKDELGVGRLFRSWGGEALYNSHEDDGETGPVLRSIGEACIVEAVISVSKIKTFCSVGERFYNRYLADRDVKTGHDPEMEGFTNGEVAVRRVIRRANTEFVCLTSCEEWNEKLP
jgi:hypothetical protein